MPNIVIQTSFLVPFIDVSNGSDADHIELTPKS